MLHSSSWACSTQGVAGSAIRVHARSRAWPGAAGVVAICGAPLLPTRQPFSKAAPTGRVV
eukprot:12902946-Prorocentrum_lima.AAC.1